MQQNLKDLGNKLDEQIIHFNNLNNRNLDFLNEYKLTNNEAL